jgi:transposase
VANQLKMALIDTIERLHRQGWSRRRIARELQIDRETVARYLGMGAAPKPATAEGALSASKPATQSEALSEASPTASATSPAANLNDCSSCTPREIETFSSAVSASSSISSAKAAKAMTAASQCEPYREQILAKLEQGLSAQRIWQDLVGEHGFPHRYHSVRRYVAKLGMAAKAPFRRMECAVGEELQVDFGQGAFLELAGGKRRRPHVFRVVLSYSRKGYCEVVLRQTTDAFLMCLENAFWHFGGVPKRIVLDNLKAAVLRADWFDPELHPKIRAFAEHYGCVFLPTKPRTPRHKGKVERGVDYVQENALKGRTFASLNEQNDYLARWESETADARVHGTTRQVVGQRFALVEKAALLPLPVERFANFQEAQRRVHPDGHIEVAKAYYSAPPEYMGHTVWARWDGRLVRIFSARWAQIAVHAQKTPGEFSTHRQHIVSEKINAVERGAEYLLGRVRHLGTSCTRWAEAMLQGRGVEGVRVLQGLLHLAHKHGSAAVSKACDAAHAHGEYRLRTVRALLKRQDAKQAVFEFMDEHPLIRPLSDYGQFVRDALHKGGSS